SRLVVVRCSPPAPLPAASRCNEDGRVPHPAFCTRRPEIGQWPVSKTDPTMRGELRRLSGREWKNPRQTLKPASWTYSFPCVRPCSGLCRLLGQRQKTQNTLEQQVPAPGPSTRAGD